MRLLSTSGDERTSQLRAMEATSAVMLAATVMGLASCLLTEPLEVTATRAAVRSEVLHDRGFPQMIIRKWRADRRKRLPVLGYGPLVCRFAAPRLADRSSGCIVTS